MMMHHEAAFMDTDKHRWHLLQAAHLDGVAKDEMCHHGIAHKHHATDKAEMDEVRACQGKGAGDNSKAGLEVHALQHAPNQQQNVDAIQGVIPCQLVHQVLHQNKNIKVYSLDICRWLFLFYSDG